MNNKRRALLKKAIIYLDLAEDCVSRATDGEQDCLDNMPENLQYSDRYEKMESAVSSLEAALESIHFFALAVFNEEISNFLTSIHCSRISLSST